MCFTDNTNRDINTRKDYIDIAKDLKVSIRWAFPKWYAPKWQILMDDRTQRVTLRRTFAVGVAREHLPCARSFR